MKMEFTPMTSFSSTTSTKNTSAIRDPRYALSARWGKSSLTMAFLRNQGGGPSPAARTRIRTGLWAAGRGPGAHAASARQARSRVVPDRTEGYYSTSARARLRGLQALAAAAQDCGRAGGLP